MPTPVPVPAPAPLPGSFADAQIYSGAPTASLANPNEGKAVVQMSMNLAGKVLNYTATTGHLSAVNVGTGKPSASFFYVAYTAGTLDPAKRPVTFFYNGGPGSSTMWLHMGSFGPKRVVTNYPSTVMPSPTQFIDNQETLLAHSDLVFVDAVGTGYSQAIAPNTNQTFWGVDSDAAAFRDFVQRYVTVNQRQASPKWLFGESYGGPRTGVMANLLEVAGMRLAGIVLQSPAMDYNSNCGMYEPGSMSCEGYIPSYAAVSAYHKLSNPAPTDFTSYMKQAREFAAGPYRAANVSVLASKAVPPDSVLTPLTALTGLSMLTWRQDYNMQPSPYRQKLLPGTMIGRYDGRMSAPLGSPLTVDNDPSVTVAGPAFTITLRNYIVNELRYSTGTLYITGNNVINVWNFSHDGRASPDTIPDVAAAMALNPALKVVAMNGYQDLATPFYQTELDLARLGNNPNVQVKNYESGHMTYLDDIARRAQRDDMITLYNSESVAK
ncbi:MAG: peptidase S10 [Pseudomonadota bacterium]